MNVVRACLLVCVSLAVGCFGNEITEFPDGLEPLGENTLAGPGTMTDAFPEEYELEGTGGSRFDQVLGRGYIHAPIADVWAAFQEPSVGADRRTSPEWSSDPINDSPYDASFVVHHIAHDVVTVEWDVTWRQGVVTGTAAEPELVAIRWQKTSGSTLISIIEGSMLLRPVGDGSITELELVYHASAAAAGTDTFVRYMQDIFNDAVAVTHGTPLPTFD